MHTFLYISQDEEKVLATIGEWRNRHGIKDINYHEIIPDPTIGIDAVRTVQHLLARKPYGGGNRLVVLRDADKATVEAQNALLKLLEEPPDTTYILLFAKNEEHILPTIRSRSQILRTASTADTADERKKIVAELVNILRAGPGKRILLSQDFSKTREETLVFLNRLIIALSAQLHQPVPGLSLSRKETATLLKHAEHARRYVEGNVSFKATLDILFLGFPKM